MSSLREKALERLRHQKASIHDMDIDSIEQLVHELKVHQVELQIQNEELRRTEIQLARVRDQFIDLYEYAPVGYLTLDEKGIIRRANLQACDFFNLDRSDLINKRLERLIYDDDRDQCYLCLKKAVNEQEPQFCELRLDRPDKRDMWIRMQVMARPLLDDWSEGFRMTLIDITELKNAEASRKANEEKFRELSKTLEEKVAERTNELARQTEQLRRLASELVSAEHRERKRLAAILHDDLQQLLVAAKVHLDYSVHQAKEPAVTEAISQAIELISKSIDSSRDLTRALRPPVLYEDGLVPALRWLASEMQERHKLEVEINACKHPIKLDDDTKALLFESVRELLFNVVKHARVNQADIQVESQNNRLEITVSDKGIGFNASQIEKSPFPKGFGLFSIRERVAALGGEMITESIPGDGTRMRINIPVRTDSAESDKAVTIQAKKETQSTALTKSLTQDTRVKVLIVDDHAIIREGIATILDDNDHIVCVGEAEDGIAALEAVKELDPDVVLMDVNMPRMNGVQATREIARHWPDIAIVALSVHDDPATTQSMLDAGASAFMRKSDESHRVIKAILKVAHKKKFS
ncbi:response regulator [candidate division KSB1 bacterium]|nr:response regulator [candidate division KSB1 bacterium]